MVKKGHSLHRNWIANVRGLKLTTVKVNTDYYGILGVTRSIDEEGIRRAYVRRAWELHPDIHPDDPDAASRMSAVNEAYCILSDPARRAMYDAQHGTVRIRVAEADQEASPISYVRRRRAHREPSVANTVLLVMSRLMQYVTAVLPL